MPVLVPDSVDCWALGTICLFSISFFKQRRLQGLVEGQNPEMMILQNHTEPLYPVLHVVIGPFSIVKGCMKGFCSLLSHASTTYPPPLHPWYNMILQHM